MSGRNGSPPRLWRWRTVPHARSGFWCSSRDVFIGSGERAPFAADSARHDVDLERVALLQVNRELRGRSPSARRTGEGRTRHSPLGALASLLAAMDRWTTAETSYAAPLAAENGVPPFPCGQIACSGFPGLQSALVYSQQLYWICPARPRVSTDFVSLSRCFSLSEELALRAISPAWGGLR